MTYAKNIPRLRGSAGFTLVEMLGVLFIIAVLIGILMPTIATVRTKAKAAKAQATIQALSVALRMYESDLGAYPPNTATEADALHKYLGVPVNSVALNIIVGPYMEFKSKELDANKFVDPWKNPYIYVSRDGGVSVSTNNANSFDLRSTGPDGPQGTIADDITNW